MTASVALLTLAASAAAQVALDVSGGANPWLAGMPPGTPAYGGDRAPNQSPVPAGVTLAPGDRILIEATGTVNHWNNAPYRCGPDGGCSPYGGGMACHAPGAEHGISNCCAPYCALLGVFLDDALPTLTPPPLGFDFRTLQSRSFLTLEPGLKQVFFMGDGLAPGGARQQFIVPNGATRLFLGTGDTGGWHDNIGQFRVLLTVIPGCAPDCDRSTGAGLLDIFDFLCFQNLFAQNDPYACDFDTSTGPAVCDIFDFLAFQNAFAVGCP